MVALVDTNILVVYTEDFAHDRIVGGVRFVDPFRAS